MRPLRHSHRTSATRAAELQPKGPDQANPMSDKHNQIMKNAVITVIQVVVSAVFLFFIYKFLLGAIGPAKMGIWSIVMALSTVARITDLGFAGGMTRFVAKYRAKQQEEAVLEVVETGVLSLIVLAFAMVALFFPLLGFLLPRVMNAGDLRDALDLLPFSLVSFAILAVSGAFLSTLDGLNRADLRNLILISATVLYGVLIPVLVWRLGFVGLGWAQLGQSGFILLAAWTTACRKLDIGLIPRRWRRDRFREMLGYNVSLQVTSVAAFLGDPLTKLLLGHFGTLAAVGYYEMATKMVNQFRAIVTNVNQIMVPVITLMHETDRAGVNRLFGQMYRPLFFICTVFYGAVAVAVPLISQIWIGHY